MTTPTPLSADPSRVFDLAAEYHAAVAAGQTPDLNDLCRESPHLLAAVQSVLMAGEQVASARHAPEPPPPAAPAALPERYQLGEQIGEGGMGVVYAGRDASLDRDIAIKLLRPDRPLSTSAVRRFTDEAKVTAQLQHPGIPAVHELGELADGRPFLAMKLIRGRTLAALVKEKGHGSAKWLGVFEAICQAVGSAHAAGVIHRDLKPANVMVGAFGEVQVMDWGLARRSRGADPGSRVETPNTPGEQSAPSPDPRSTLDDPHAEATDDGGTKAGTVLGTPAYMAPEQARGEVDHLDRRTDVYCLGAILCELLTGRPPHVGSSADVVAWAAAGELADAHARLGGCGEDPALVALAKRCLSVNPLARPMDASEVATAVASFRSETEARAKRAEVDRGRAETRATETRKRQRAIAWAAGIALAILLGGLAVSLWQMNRAMAAESDAVSNAQQARDERDAKDLARRDAEQNLDFFRKSNTALTGVYSALHPGAKYHTAGELRTALLETLRRAVADLDTFASGDPLEVAGIQDTLGLSLLGLGDPASALTLFERVRTARSARLGPDHLDTLAAVSHVAQCHQASGQVARAIPLFEQVRRGREEQLGPDHSDTLASMNNLANGYQDANQNAKALPLLKQVVDGMRAKHGPDHPSYLIPANNLASTYQTAGETKKAVSLLEDVVPRMKAAVRPDHPDALRCQSNLAGAYLSLGRSLDAVRLLEEVVERAKAAFGADHPDTVVYLGRLVEAYRSARKFEPAAALLEQQVAWRKFALGADNPDALASAHELAYCYRAGGKADKAVPLLEDVVPRMRVVLGVDHPTTLAGVGNLALCYDAVGQRGKGLPLHEEVCRRMKAIHGPDHPHAIAAIGNLGAAYIASGDGEKAAVVLCEFVVGQRKRHAAGSVPFADILDLVALDLLRSGQFAAAEPMLRESLGIHQKNEPDAWTTSDTRSALGWALLEQKKYSDAEPLLVKGYEGLKAREKGLPRAASARIPETLDRLIELYTATDKPDEVKKYKDLRAKYPAAKKEVLPPRTDK